MNAPTFRLSAAQGLPLTPPPEPGAQLSLVQRRLVILAVLFMLVTAGIALRLVQLCFFDHARHRVAASGPPPRGQITDRNGVPLATTIESTALAVNPRKVLGDKNKLAEDLARLMPERSVADYRRILFGKSAFAYLRRPAPPELVAAANALGEKGILLLPESRRLFPQGTLAGHVLGYAQTTEHGLTGIGVERFFNDQLSRNEPIRLTIDARVQAAVEGEIARRMAQFGAAGGAGIVLDVDTGEVIALASLPTINPNAPLRSAAVADNHDMVNKATMATFELGSTFKMITFANAIEHGVITDWSRKYNVSRPLIVGGRPIRDDEPQMRPLSVPEIMTFSSNIGTAQIAVELGEERIKAMFHSLGFYDRTSIELRERGLPQVPGYWAQSTVMTTAFGHGIAVTPLHLAEAFAALANGGVWHPATLRPRDPAQPVPGKRVISEATSAKIRQLMRLVVLQGTGTNANAPGMRVGGKTGTAEKNVNGHYVHSSNVTTFAGAFPMDHPRYVVLALLDDAKAIKETYGRKTAGWNSAPLAKQIVARIGPLLGVRPTTDPRLDIDVSDLLPLILEKKVPGKNAID